MKPSRRITTLLLLALLLVTAVTALTACKPKDYDMSGVVFNDVTYTYDGTEKKLEIIGTLPEGVTVTYTNNTLTNVGEVLATAVFSGDTKRHNPIPPMTAKLKVVPATFQGIALADKTVTYNGEEQTLELTGTLPEGSTVTYTNNKATDAGTYNVTAVVTNANYETKTLTATLTINKADYDMSGVFFEDITVPYIGIPYSLVVFGELPEGVTVQYTENTITDAGQLQVTATFTGDSNHNTIPSKTATITVVNDGSYHTVLFVLSETDIQLRVVKHGEALTDIPEIPEVAGYAGSWGADLTAITEDMVLAPQYSIATYTVTYVCGKGTNNPANPTEFTMQSSTLPLSDPTPEKMGYTFAGWYTTETFETGTRVYSIATGTTNNLTLYAKWIGYCIESAEGFTFDYQNYELPAITMSIAHNKTLLPLSTVIQVSDGCTWKLSNDIEGMEIITTKNISLQIGHNIKYVTVWYNANAEYNLVYILDVYRLQEFTYSFINETLPYGEVVTADENTLIPEPTAPQKPGYTFLGWLPNEATTVATFPYKLTQDTIFVASYKPNDYKITAIQELQRMLKKRPRNQ